MHWKYLKAYWIRILTGNGISMSTVWRQVYYKAIFYYESFKDDNWLQRKFNANCWHIDHIFPLFLMYISMT